MSSYIDHRNRRDGMQWRVAYGDREAPKFLAPNWDEMLYTD